MERALVIMTALIFLLSGCAVIQQKPSVELDHSRLSCTNPEIVDGDLKTAAALPALDTDKHPLTNSLSVDVVGDRTGTFIKLDKPTYVTYVEIFAASKIPYVHLYTMTKEPKDDAGLDDLVLILRHFAREWNREKNTKINAGEVRRFWIGKKMIGLFIATGWLLDTSRGPRTINNTKFVSVKGPMLREVKLYTQ